MSTNNQKENKKLWIEENWAVILLSVGVAIPTFILIGALSQWYVFVIAAFIAICTGLGLFFTPKQWKKKTG